jgi:hypothetical protein
MSFLVGLLGGGSQAKQTTQAAGIQSQTSVAGKPIPLIYGVTRVAPNYIWYGAFNAVQSNSGGGGGKGGILGGGGGKGGGGTEYTYYASFIGALGEGYIEATNQVWINKSVTNLAAEGCGFTGGSIGQAAWGYLAQFQANVSETDVIPSGGQIVVSSAALFMLDDGVYLTNTANFTNSGTTAPGAYQYSISSYGSSAVYTFNSSNSADYITISYAIQQGGIQTGPGGNVGGSLTYYTSSTTVPSSSPYAVTVTFSSGVGAISGTIGNLAPAVLLDDGVFQTTYAPFSSVSSLPGVNQYDCSNGTYQFNPANWGDTVTINYYQNGEEPVTLAYNGIAYFYAANFSLGNSAQLPNFNIEAYGLLEGTAPNGYDADPSQVVYDLLTNPRYGAGVPSSNVANLSNYQNYCLATGLWISPYYDSQTSCQSMFDDIAQATNSAVVWSSGLINFVPYGDQAITANGYTYTPPSSPLYSLTDNDFMKNTTGTSNLQSDNPVQLIRMRVSDSYNSIKLEYLDRGQYYQPAIAQATLLSQVNQYGLRQDAVRTFHMFCDGNAANLSTTLQLQREQIRNNYSFQVDQRYIVLDPMDIIAITDSYLGLNAQWVRILTITENDDMSLSITAEEYLAGTGSAPLYSYGAGQGYLQNYNQTAGNVNAPIIFEPPAMYQEELEVIMGVCGNSLYGGCQVWISTDDVTYLLAGTITGGNRMGMLTAALSSVSSAATGYTYDTSSTLSVNLSQSQANLGAASQTSWINLQSLCYVGGELIAYENSNLTTAYNYNLTNLIRGCFGSTIATAQIGAPFLRMDSNVFSYPYNASQIGNTISIKLLSFNLWGGGLQQLADVLPYYYTLQGTAFTSPLPNVTGFATAYIGTLTQLIWDAVSDFRSPDYEIRQGTTWNTGNVLGRTPLTSSGIAGDGTYWVAAHFSVPGGSSNIYSTTPSDLIITGSQITQNVIASYDQVATGWAGTFSSTVVTSLGLQLGAAGNILTVSSILGLTNYLYFDGVASSGTYEIPSSQIVNVGRVTPCQVIMKMGTEVGYSINAINVLGLANYLPTTNILGIDLGNNTSATAQIALSQDGVTWAAWQNWIPGSYSAKAFNAQVVLETLDPSVLAVLTDFTFTVDVPTLTQQGNNISISSGVNVIPYGYTYNGGVGNTNTPNLQITILNGSAGDDALVTSSTLSSFSLEIVNGGSPVSRNVNYLAEGY